MKTVLTYVPWLIKEIFVAGFSLSLDSLKADNGYHPVVVRYPLRITNAWEIFWFTSSITATPGTLSLGLREPPREGLPRIVIVQAVQGNDPKAIVESLADMEQRLAPHVKGIDYGVPGQGPHAELDAAFYEYPLDTLGRHMRSPDLANAEDTPLAADATAKHPVWPGKQGKVTVHRGHRQAKGHKHVEGEK
ncbi:monovalent cation/H+ antiporter subunit E [Corynebacterium lizhenjunii]|uniref:Monovalent cation/H+ antiporter subunit E n=1 Tax=Corynebacterium lizhenjunii TaxID=2709394 RepID=A0A7T0KDA2_9CORY|nr:monovalent cation/H+ antiporter subunit E [Corynebacterium lizhenjunii]QPK78442.1 monovalent cation/H+ antiporter subunit E [Corynebacterium lizhenjunii]